MNKPIVILGEAFGANEVKTQTAFVGASGLELLRMLDEAGVVSLTSIDHSYMRRYWDNNDPNMLDAVWNLHPELHRTNVFTLHPHGNQLESLCVTKTSGEPRIPGYPALTKGKFLSAQYAHHLDRLGDELIEIDPNLVVALGNAAIWALLGTTGISKLRGTTHLSTHTAAGFKVLPTYHPAAVLREWELRPVTVIDLQKAARESAFPEIRRPAREIWIDPTLEDLETFYENHIRGCNILGCDIETAGNQITCIGFAPSPAVALVIRFHDTRKPGKSYWPSAEDELSAWSFVRRIISDPAIPKVFQNGLYDIAFLWRSVAIATYGAVEDTMLLHHALQPESLKSLGFLGSIYSDEGAWKQERKTTTTIKRDE